MKFVFFFFPEIAQLANCDSGTAETLEADESINVSFPVMLLLLLNVSKENLVCAPNPACSVFSWYV